MNEEMRERIALILESVASNGVSNPRDLDVALDAIGAEIMDVVAAERKACYEIVHRARLLLHRYLKETPLRHQPHMIAHEASAMIDALDAIEKETPND